MMFLRTGGRRSPDRSVGIVPPDMSWIGCKDKVAAILGQLCLDEETKGTTIWYVVAAHPVPAVFGVLTSFFH